MTTCIVNVCIPLSFKMMLFSTKIRIGYLMNYKSLLIAAASIILVGCAAAPAQKEAMTVTKQSMSSVVKNEQKNKFEVKNITGGKTTNPFWTSQVSNQNFEGALKDSITAAGLNAEANNGKYKIDAELISIEQPIMGFTFDVVSTVNYKVYNDNFSKSFPITAKGSATTSDAFAGVTRLKIANERSILENITEFIKQLSNSNIE